MILPLTDEQRRDIVRLRKARAQWKVIARQVKCTVAQAIYVWKLASDRTYAAKRRRRMAQTQRIRRAIKALGKTMCAVRFAEHGVETLGQRIRRLRVAKGWSGSHLAVQLGCSEPAVSYWENDLRKPQPQWLGELSRVFETPVSYLEIGEAHAIRAGASQRVLLAMVGAAG